MRALDGIFNAEGHSKDSQALLAALRAAEDVLVGVGMLAGIGGSLGHWECHPLKMSQTLESSSRRYFTDLLSPGRRSCSLLASPWCFGSGAYSGSLALSFGGSTVLVCSHLWKQLLAYLRLES